MRLPLKRRRADALPGDNLEIGDGMALSMMGRSDLVPGRVGGDALIAAPNHAGKPGRDKGALKGAGHICPVPQPVCGRNGRIWFPDSALYG